MVRALLDSGYEKPDDDIDTVDEMAVKPYVDHDSDDDDDLSSVSSSQPRQVFTLGRQHYVPKSTKKLSAATAKQPTKMHGTAVVNFYASVIENLRCQNFFLGVSIPMSESVSDSVHPENLVNTISSKQMKGILPNSGQRCTWVQRCTDYILG